MKLFLFWRAGFYADAADVLAYVSFFIEFLELFEAGLVVVFFLVFLDRVSGAYGYTIMAAAAVLCGWGIGFQVQRCENAHQSKLAAVLFVYE